MTEYKNLSGTPMPSIVDTEYRGCNFAQPAPVQIDGVWQGVRLFPGDDTPRVFRDCNLCNAEPPPGSIVISCNTIVKQFGVSVEAPLAPDGPLVTRSAGIVHGRYVADRGEYEYFESPQIVLEEGE